MRATLGMSAVERHVIAFLQRVQHVLEGAHAALVDEPAAVVAGTADGADAQPFRGDRIDLTVAMPRHQHLGAMLGAPMNGMRKCWPCHIAMITGMSRSNRS